jgi:hypothetical protein
MSSPLPPGERVRVRGMHEEEIFGFAEPPHPDLLPRGEKGISVECRKTHSPSPR